MTNFKQRLQAAGYGGGTDQFYCQVAGLFTTHFPNQTDEQLKRHPREALRFCDIVRNTLALLDLADDVVLGALENHRKHRKRLAGTAY
jgi:hypothetical protein